MYYVDIFFKWGGTGLKTKTNFKQIWKKTTLKEYLNDTKLYTSVQQLVIVMSLFKVKLTGCNKYQFNFNNANIIWLYTHATETIKVITFLKFY